ncbi:N utilization substance protein B [Actinobaculum suis]|uniref:N utilization substance protein B n=1 Tax=Actinobaculum suis TaxID=1657 RepID=A0A1G7C2S0_9ACTO|nr:transcription antitermination protein NusB [Actinobaculum suis]MDY5153138.1 transcription antitermination protein NusB [Actinobaculum suis]SDE33579.1 N utilization substance protein B [Actinobaculum suis]
MARRQHAKRRKYAKQKGRSTQRHRALDVLFEADEKGIATEQGIRDLLAERQKVSTAQVPIGEFGSEIVEHYAGHILNLNTLIEAASEDWPLHRMNSVDRNILRGAAAELTYMDTPRAVVVPEWADLARSLSTDRSVGFVMGVMNRMADIRERELANQAKGSILDAEARGETIGAGAEVSAPSASSADTAAAGEPEAEPFSTPEAELCSVAEPRSESAPAEAEAKLEVEPVETDAEVAPEAEPRSEDQSAETETK